MTPKTQDPLIKLADGADSARAYADHLYQKFTDATLAGKWYDAATYAEGIEEQWRQIKRACKAKLEVK